MLIMTCNYLCLVNLARNMLRRKVSCSGSFGIAAALGDSFGLQDSRRGYETSISGFTDTHASPPLMSLLKTPDKMSSRSIGPRFFAGISGVAGALSRASCRAFSSCVAPLLSITPITASPPEDEEELRVIAHTLHDHSFGQQVATFALPSATISSRHRCIQNKSL